MFLRNLYLNTPRFSKITFVCFFYDKFNGQYSKVTTSLPSQTGTTAIFSPLQNDHLSTKSTAKREALEGSRTEGITSGLVFVKCDSSADLDVQLVQLNHCDGEYSNF